MVVNCLGCGIALNVPDEAKGRQVRCTGCGHVFMVPVDGAVPADAAPFPQPAAPFPQPQFGPAAFQGAPGAYQPSYGDEVYQDNFNLQNVHPNTRAYWCSWRPETFSTAGAILLDIFTCSLFGLIYYGLKFSELPKASRNDFTAGKAIGFMFIPIFNLYWMFRFWLGLCDRINLQIRLRGRTDLLLSRALAKTVCILSVLQGGLQFIGMIVYFGMFGALALGGRQANPGMMVFPSMVFLGLLQLLGTAIVLAYLVCREIFIGKMQTAINVMAAPAMAMPGQEARAWQ